MDAGSRIAKVVLLIALKENAGKDKFQSNFAALADRNRSKLGKTMGQTWSTKIPQSEMKIVPHQILMKDSPAPFDAMVQLSSLDQALVPEMTNAIVQVANDLGDYLDKSRSTAFVGTEVAITQGIGPVHLAMALRRLPSLSHEQFMAHWFGRHASIGEAVEGVHYRQNHVSTAETEALCARMGLGLPVLDGLVDSYFATPEAAVELLSRDEVGVGAIDDEKLFIDHTRSHFGFCRDFVQIAPSK